MLEPFCRNAGGVCALDVEFSGLSITLVDCLPLSGHGEPGDAVYGESNGVGHGGAWSCSDTDPGSHVEDFLDSRPT